MAGQSDLIPLVDFVKALRKEIRTAQAGADPALPFELGPVSVEFSMVTSQEGEGKAGLRFWVVDAGAAAKVATVSTQKVTMQLTPLAQP